MNNYITGKTLDDILRRLIQKLLRSDVSNASKGEFHEIPAVLIKLQDPLARISRSETKGTIMSCLGEFLWYLSRGDDLSFIKYYIDGYEQFSDDGVTLNGAYGKRIYFQRDIDQISSIIALLKKKPSSRQAVIQIFNAEDIIKDTNDIPCTLNMQILVRKDKLSMITTMRSNDAFKGLPHDVFSFTMLQELIARHLNYKLGSYFHFAGSMHLYLSDKIKAESYINEDFQERLPMPPMPENAPFDYLAKLLATEISIRTGRGYGKHYSALPNYWKDLATLLRAFKESGNPIEIELAKRDLCDNRFYNQYIEKRATAKVRPNPTPRPSQLILI